MDESLTLWDAARGFKGKADAGRIAFPFQRYQALTSLLPAAREKAKPARRKRNQTPWAGFC